MILSRFISLLCILLVPLGEILVLRLAELAQHLFNQVLSAQHCVEHICSIITLDWHLVDVLGLIVLCIDLIESILSTALRHLYGWVLCDASFGEMAYGILGLRNGILLHWLCLSNIWLLLTSSSSKYVDILFIPIGRCDLIEIVHIVFKLIAWQ